MMIYSHFLNDLELLLYRLMHLNNLLFYYVSLTQYLIGWFKNHKTMLNNQMIN